MTGIAQLITSITSRPTCNLSFYGIKGRNKMCDLSKSGSFTTRLIMTPEDTIKRILNIVANRLTRAISKMPDTEIWLAKKNSDGNLPTFLKSKLRPTYESKYVCADFSKFDMNVREELIVVSFGVLRSMLPKGKSIDHFFLFACSSIVIKFICLPEGYCYRLTKGLASGNPFTSLIGRIVNFLVTRHALRVSTPKPHKIICAFSGDDSIINLNGNEVDLFEIEKGYHDIGLSVGSIFDCYKDFTRGEVNYPSFLGKIFNEAGDIGWDYDRLYDKLSNPEHDVKYHNEIDRVTALVSSAPGPFQSTRLLQDYFL